ncbi:MAG: ABC transporter substrate-binding protein [Spirochaetales bacterium]|nr:ABC transporter substrate-binding protein [Spirochaetales bacterium]
MQGKIGKGLMIVCVLSLFIPFAVFAGGQKDDVILIGAPMPLTGPYASDGEQMRMALELAVEEKNAAGGLLGKQLKLITGDVGALEPEKIKAVGERLAGQNVHVALTGYADSGVDARVFAQYAMPYIHADAMTEDALVARKQIADTGTSNLFQYCPAEVAYGEDASEYLFKVPAAMGWTPPNKNIAVVKVDYSYNILAADKFAELSAAKGYKIVVDETIQFGHVEFGPILSKIKDAGASFVTFWDLDPKDAANFMKQFYDAFIDEGIQALVYMQFTPVIPEFLDLAGEAAEGLLWSTTVNPVSDGVADYDKRWIAKFGSEPASSYSYGTRDGFDLWVAAVERAGTVDDFEAVIEELKKTDHRGLTGRIVFDPEDHTAYAGMDYIPTVWQQVWGGRHNKSFPKEFAGGYAYKLPPWVK